MKLRKNVFGMLLPIVAAAASLQAAANPALVVTASNAAANQLMVYDSDGNWIQTVNTGGKGGVSGNAGGIEAAGGLVAVVNFGSQNVSLFQRAGNSLQWRQRVSTVTDPVSVAFGADHLYILGTTKVESHLLRPGPPMPPAPPMPGTHMQPGPPAPPTPPMPPNAIVDSTPDGVVSLFLADGSAAQVGVLPGHLVITEKGATTTGTIETVNLLSDGAVTGVATQVMDIPANPLAPFGLVTRGNDAYVTIAHSNEITLVRDGKVLTVAGSGTQNAPCWLALEGPFLFSSNSPSMSVSRYAVYGQKIVQDAAVAATLSGDPTDIAYGAGLVAVIDGSGHLSIFSVDEDGNLTLVKADTIPAAANGAAVIWGD
jgi:hypothetical protein